MLRQIYSWHAKRIAGRYADEVKKRLTNEEWNELVALARTAHSADPWFRIVAPPLTPTTGDANGRENAQTGRKGQWPEYEAALDPEAILSNPFITPYRRPAFRLLPVETREKLFYIPIVATPALDFGAFSRKFACSGRPFVEIPFGVMFLLRPIGEIAIGIYVSDVEKKTADIEVYRDALLALIREMSSPTPTIFLRVNERLGTLSRPSLKFVHTSHVMGSFILLHEFGHVILDHWVPNIDAGLGLTEYDRLRLQELSADEFAAQCILRPKEKSSIPWDDIRELHLLIVCLLLIVLQKLIQVPRNYPRFEERRQALLDTFKAPQRLRSSVSRMEALFDSVAP
jgi:hypothetical protein